MRRIPRSSGSAALFAGDVPVFIYNDIDGIDLRVVHGGEIGVLCEDDGHRARVLEQIVLDRLVWFEDVDGKNDRDPSLNSFAMSSTRCASSSQYLHQVVQNSKRTICPY